MDHGCVYFEHKRHHAGRGYAYVAISRFRSRAGCHLYGKLRQSDFLPVGIDRDDEVWERGEDSMNSDSSEYERHHVADPDEPNSSDSESEYEEMWIESNPLNTPSACSINHNEALDTDFAF